VAKIIFRALFIFTKQKKIYLTLRNKKMKDTQKIVIFNLILIFCLTAFVKVKADISDSTALSLQVSQGALSVDAPAQATFAGKSFSFDNQISANNPIDSITTTDARGNRAGWGINISASDWTNGTNVIKHNGNGVDEGLLTLDIPTINNVTALAGDDKAGLTMGTDASFGTSSINLVTAAAESGSGQYTISGLNASQIIPGNQLTGEYVTNLTLTIS
jgi:hypothetical protein